MLKISESLFDFEEAENISAEKVKKMADRILADYRKRESEKLAQDSPKVR